MNRCNVLKVGATRMGKTLAAARSILEAADEAAVIFDPHKQSLAQAVLTHVTGNVLYDKLSDVRSTLGFELLAPSVHPDPVQRHLDNQRRAEAFVISKAQEAGQEIRLGRQGVEAREGRGVSQRVLENIVE